MEYRTEVHLDICEKKKRYIIYIYIIINFILKTIRSLFEMDYSGKFEQLKFSIQKLVNLDEICKVSGQHQGREAVTRTSVLSISQTAISHVCPRLPYTNKMSVIVYNHIFPSTVHDTLSLNIHHGIFISSYVLYLLYIVKTIISDIHNIFYRYTHIYFM